MKVSVIVVTGNREHFLPAIHHCYARQTCTDSELLVLDDSAEPSPFFTRLRDPRVTYRHLDHRLSVGAKRNALIRQAHGDWICHFDDDDYYTDGYIESMLRQARGFEFAKLGGWYNYSLQARTLTYLDATRTDALCFEQTGSGLQRRSAHAEPYGPGEAKWIYGYGFSYCYRRTVALAHPFPDQDFGEDHTMAMACLQSGVRIRLVQDEAGLVLHQLHAGSTSSVTPQYRLPTFLLDRLFPGHAHYLRMLGSLEQELCPTSATP